MRLTITVVEVVVFFGLTSLWRVHACVGSLRVWTIVPIVSAIVAPMLGELGPPIDI